MTTLVKRGAAVVMLAIVVAACGVRMAGNSQSSVPASPSVSSSVAATTASTPTEPAATPSPPDAKLPPRFPVMPNAHSAQLPDDPGVVARWTVEQLGSAAYDWYVAALPDAGFEILGTYPTERAALIRFRDSGGRTWQLLAELVDERTQISLQTDRP